MIRVIIIDDEPLARSIIKEYLSEYPQVELIAECNDGFEGVKAIMQLQPDLVFLDIQMPKINGFEMLELVDPAPAVIFTTAFDEYAIKAFETHAIDYLLKPFSRERFKKALNKFLDQTNMQKQKEATTQLLNSANSSPSQTDRVVVKTAGKIKIIPFRDILYFEASDDYVKIHTREGAFLKNKTMGHFENTLPPTVFVRIHRSYIINVQEITRIDPYEKDNHLAILRSGQRVPVSKTGYPRLREVLGL
ncbi:LytR/AlgR family response regulator transcription factor [Flavisolibacter ginsengisoli]|jgi:two-component system LytT family response regulator|uniref:Two component transcriptional regulator, LytTR family n=1 Tax=Flavisolibacter ginsengisoli DSM 18119 TaxID=1121884 RepID=A0A1M4XDX0_9BACT|nr:LytTR family transcriptional regulator DNA-binding domain-containing protein [Flavisolibacter ginsengisoli]SHE91520.1 two component transcriptional regulator, LytTR family [Flavisolibacter ginsengisoli DSM 18119]